MGPWFQSTAPPQDDDRAPAEVRASLELFAMSTALTGATPRPSGKFGWYIPVLIMGTAKLFRNGRSQAVRLPKEFRFEGKK